MPKAKRETGKRGKGKPKQQPRPRKQERVLASSKIAVSPSQKSEELSLDTDSIREKDLIQNPSLAVDESIKVVTAAAEMPKFGKITTYITNLFAQVSVTNDKASALHSLKVMLILTSPAKMECVLSAFDAARLSNQSFVDVFLQYFKVLQLGTNMEEHGVPWTKELKAAVNACLHDMNASFLPALIDTIALCSTRVQDTRHLKYLRRLDAANTSFAHSLRAVEHAMKKAAKKAVPQSLQTRLLSMAWTVMWYMFLAACAALLTGFVLFYAHLIFNWHKSQYTPVSDLTRATLNFLKTQNVPAPIVSFLTTVAETNSAPAFWADVQRHVLDASSWWHVGTPLLGAGPWLSLLNAVFNPTGAVFYFVNKWTRMITYTNMLYKFAAPLTKYIMDPIIGYIAPSLAPVATNLGLTSIGTFLLISSFISFGSMLTMAKTVYSLGKYIVSLVTTTRTITLGYTCDHVVHACVPFTNKDEERSRMLKYDTLDECVQRC